jgi:FkbM family methyltransferase
VLRRIKNIAKFTIRDFIYCHIDSQKLTLEKINFWTKQMKQWPAIFSPKYTRRIEIYPNMFMQIGLIDYLHRCVAIDGVWDEKVLHVLTTRLREGHTFYDVGANTGYFSLIASRLVGDSGRVVSFEPSLRALSQLTGNIVDNKLVNILLLSIAAGPQDKLAELLQSSEGNIGMTTLCDHLGYRNVEHVPVFQIDKITESLGLSPSMVKIDVEGYEFEALKGMAKTLVNHRPVVLMEVSRQWLAKQGEAPVDIYNFMQGHGYNAFAVRLDNGINIVPLAHNDFTSLKDQEEILFSPS